EARVEAVAQEIEALTRIVEQNTAATEQAKAEATSGELHSPSDGIVVARHGQPGDTVDPSVKLVEIATELTALQAIVTPDPASLGKIQAGQPAVVRIGDQEIAGAVQEVRNGEVVVYFNTGEPIHTAEVPAQVRIKF
ncbi:MAG: HlyD family efflux transporter periplasmic adaptor subunit, partial [Acidobacteriia bacterium]|nr:HlyD family efflux transporter periplasmic adaptor subunit [Terriglobia bacterium]